jgi:hypothetical protein
VPHRRSSWLARNSHAYTHEPYRLALERLSRFPGRSIPTASVAQQHLEHEVLRHIGYCGITDGHGGRPGQAPFAIDWLRPLPDLLEIGVKEEALPDLLGALMPTLIPGSEPQGIRGLRPRMTRRGIELRRLGLPGLLRLRGVRLRSWRRAIDIAQEMWDDPAAVLLWRTHPHEMHPEEQALAYGFDAGYAPDSEGLAVRAPAASTLLRRHMVFREAPAATGIAVWMNLNCIELEWDGGPDHATVTQALLDPVFGVPGAVNDECFCRDASVRPDRCFSVEVEFAASPGVFVNLRRGTGGWSDWREQRTERSRTRRAEAMRRHRQTP